MSSIIILSICTIKNISGRETHNIVIHCCTSTFNLGLHNTIKVYVYIIYLLVIIILYIIIYLWYSSNYNI